MQRWQGGVVETTEHNCIDNQGKGEGDMVEKVSGGQEKDKKPRLKEENPHLFG